MKCLTIITDDELVQKLAVYYDDDGNIDEIKSEIMCRIAKKANIKPADIELIAQIIEIAEEIEMADSDMLRQSETMRELGRCYHELKKRLLACIKNESDLLCETT